MSATEPPVLKELSQMGAENNPNRIAFGNGIDGRVVTWREFDAESNRAAQAMREHTSQGDRVAFLCEGSVEHVTLWNGALKAGCVVSNLHVRQSPSTTQACIDSLRPRVLVVGEKTAEFFETEIRDELSSEIDVVVTTDEPKADYEQSLESFTAGQPATEPDVRVKADDVSVVMWTSGTTGKPKGWCHTNRALIMRGMKLAHKKERTRDSGVPNVFTPSFAAWYSSILPTMLANGSTYFLKSWDPETYVELIQERSLTSCNLVPTMWREILRLESLDDYDLSSLSNIESGGETLDTTTLKQLRDNICSSVSQSYAATEAVGTSISHPEMQGERIDSVGKPVLGSRIRVIEPGGSPDEPLEPGEVGELIVKSSDAPAYRWGEPSKTSSSFQDGWWYSGDLGYKDEDGYLFLEGRDDDMITSKGIKVYPAPVEERLNNHPDVIESAVVGVDDEEYGEKVVAYVHTKDSDLTAADLDEWCLESEELARMERPRDYHFTSSPLPRTASDKLDRKAVEQKVK